MFNRHFKPAMMGTGVSLALIAMNGCRQLPGRPGTRLPNLYALGGRLTGRAPRNNLQFNIWMRKKSTRAGKLVRVWMQFKNVGAEPIVISFGYFGQPLPTKMVVYGPGISHPARPTAWGLHSEIDTGIRTMMVFVRKKLPAGASWQPRQPIGRLTITRYFHMTRPGKYYIQFHYGAAVSNVCKVLITR